MALFGLGQFFLINLIISILTKINWYNVRIKESLKK